MKKPNAFRRGFTLIELMIVIVILGVLMGTILPRLTGAQARARDTGRIADLNTIGQALETYFDDNGQYPGTSGTAVCLDSGAAAIIEALGSYLKGGIVPSPAPSQITAVGGITCTGAYLYVPLKNRGIDTNGYALFTDVETYQKANVISGDVSDFTSATDTTNIAGNIENSMGALKSADAAANTTLYVVYN